MRRRHLRPPSTTPIEVVIETLSHEGRGVARIDGKTVFVDGALPGERVRARYLREHRRYDETVATEILEPASTRVEPPCRHYGVCGGCSLQHLDHKAQLRHKEAILLEQLHHAGGIAPRSMLAPLTSPGEGYRQRGRLSARFLANKHRAQVGFRERRSNMITEITHCEVLHPRVGALLPDLSALVSSLSVADAVPQIELAVSEQDCGLVLRHVRSISSADHERLLAFEREHDVRFYLQPGGETTVVPLEPARPPVLSYRLEEFDVEIRFGPTDFTQVNFHINRQLVARVVELLNPDAQSQMLDLFCGLGNFSLPLARRAGNVTGVEGLAHLVAGARDNAARNGIDNAEFLVANLAREDLEAPFLPRPWDRILLDPPRAGAFEVLTLLNHTGVQALVYVSCNPATLARDAALLVNERGYVLDAAGIVDMFPHTSHVECLAKFTRP